MHALMWRLSDTHAVLYTDDRGTLRAALAYPKFPHRDATAATTYCRKSGRAFAWQITFPASLWNGVVRHLGRGSLVFLDDVKTVQKSPQKSPRKPAPARSPAPPSRPAAPVGAGKPRAAAKASPQDGLDRPSRGTADAKSVSRPSGPRAAGNPPPVAVTVAPPRPPRRTPDLPPAGAADAQSRGRATVRSSQLSLPMPDERLEGVSPAPAKRVPGRNSRSKTG